MESNQLPMPYTNATMNEHKLLYLISGCVVRCPLGAATTYNKRWWWRRMTAMMIRTNITKELREFLIIFFFFLFIGECWLALFSFIMKVHTHIPHCCWRWWRLLVSLSIASRIHKKPLRKQRETMIVNNRAYLLHLFSISLSLLPRQICIWKIESTMRTRSVACGSFAWTVNSETERVKHSKEYDGKFVKWLQRRDTLVCLHFGLWCRHVVL